MDRNDVDWRGYFAAAPTPFTRQGALDESALAEVLGGLADDGAHGVLANGSTGEWYCQTVEERIRVAEIAIKELRGRAPILIGVSSIHEAETIELAQHACEAGSDGVVYSPPPAARLTQAEVVAFYERTAARIPGKVMAYNIPADVSTDIAPETLDEVANIDNVVAVKDSTSDDLQFHRTIGLVGDRVRVFGNLLTPAGLSLMAGGYGGDGHFGAGMLLGPRTAEAFDLLWAGDTAAALAIAAEFDRVRSTLNTPDGNGVAGGAQAQLKAVMRLLGKPAGYPRLPRLAVEDDPEALALLTSLLSDLGLRPQP
ncbi:dihydrodipicolinate synthase family protein [Kribbella sp. NPDC004536]|uniref:dihydrodipicolinate synthase family protein n=1 Tax=Kribbella sp. NPDC004536 TaxID=3364106 RepID=UPI0036B9C40A